MHDNGVGADALDARPERYEKTREVLHVRLGRDIAQMGGAVRRNDGGAELFETRLTS